MSYFFSICSVVNMDVITLETNHLSQGTPNPSKQNGILRLYSMKFCPYAQRVRLILLIKKLRHEIVNVDLKRKPDWFLELNPLGKVPVLDIGSKVLMESLDISDYLDETYLEPKLYPNDDEAKARDKQLIKNFDKVIEWYYMMLWDSEAKPLSKHVDSILALLEEYEKELSIRGDYFGGKEPGMVDYMIWPWAERAEVIDLVHGEKLPISEDKISRIRAWCINMNKLDVIKNTVVSKERAHKLFKFYLAGGSFDYESI